MRILCLGDSMTDRPEGSYVKALWHLAHGMDEDNKVEGASWLDGQDIVLKVSTSAIEDMETTYPANTYVLQGGGDELDAGTSPERLLGQFDVVAKMARECGKRLLILLCPWQHKPRRLGPEISGRIIGVGFVETPRQKFNRLLVESYPDNTLDYFSVLWDDKERYIADAPHPSDEGDRKMAELIWEKLQTMK